MASDSSPSDKPLCHYLCWQPGSVLLSRCPGCCRLSSPRTCCSPRRVHARFSFLPDTPDPLQTASRGAALTAEPGGSLSLLLGCDSHPRSAPMPRRREGRVQTLGVQRSPKFSTPSCISAPSSAASGRVCWSHHSLYWTPQIRLETLDLTGVQLCPCHPRGLSLHGQHGQRCPLRTQLPTPPVFASFQGTNKCP